MTRVAAITVVLVAVVAVTVATQATAGAATHEQGLTRAQLVERAFTICAAASNGIARVRPAFSLSRSDETLAEVLVHLRRAVERLSALQAAPRDAPRLQRYLALMRRQNAALGRAARAARRGDRATFRAAYLDAGGVSLQARTAANRLGLAVCGTL